MRVCIIGLGKVGKVNAKYIQSKGIEVYGYDISQKSVENAEANNIWVTTDWEKIPSNIDVFIVNVYAGLNNGNPDMSAIFDVCSKIKEKSKECLVSIESTLLVGTCRKIWNEIFCRNTDFNIVHVPHRWYEADQEEHGVNQPRIIGGINEYSLDNGNYFYKHKLGISLFNVLSIELAEMSKITENAYRYVQIAFAEELKMICQKLGIDFFELRKACNTKWNINILEALDGIGGTCLPKDLKFYLSLTDKANLVKKAKQVNDDYEAWLCGYQN